MLSVLLTAMLIQSSKGAFFSDKILSKEDLDVTQEGNKYSVNISVVNFTVICSGFFVDQPLLVPYFVA